MRKAVIFLSLAAVAGCGSGNEAGGAAPAATIAPTAAPSAAPAQAAVPATIAGGAVSKEELAGAVCYYSPDEIRTALGFSVEAGVPETGNLQSYGMATCVYNGPDNTLRLTANWIDPEQIEATRRSMTMMSGGGKVETILGDPDSAYLHDQQDNGSSIHYLRRNIRIQAHATSGMVPFATMKPKLLALRRVP